MIRMQMIFVILAGILLQTLILNEANVNNNTVETISNNYIAEHAIATAEECLTKFTGKRLAFDEYLISNSVAPTEGTSKLSQLSSTLGRNNSEISTNSDTFDDVDDYNNFDTLIRFETNGNQGIHVKCKVQYFDQSTGNTTTSKTWHKKITVFVSDSIVGTNKHFLVDQDGNRLELQKYAIKSFYNIIN